jgi:hypothetical protein
MATVDNKTGEHILPVSNRVAESDWRCKADHVDVETVLIPAATYSAVDDSVRLHLTTADVNSTSPPTPGNLLKTEIKDTAPLACVLRETL